MDNPSFGFGLEMSFFLVAVVLFLKGSRADGFFVLFGAGGAGFVRNTCDFLTENIFISTVFYFLNRVAQTQ